MKPIESNTDLIPEAFTKGTALIVRPKGDIDLHNSPELRDALLAMTQDHGTKDVILNLEQVSYMDSSAIAVLVELLQRVRKNKGTVALSGLQPRVRGLMEIARLDRIFKITGTEAEALTEQS